MSKKDIRDRWVMSHYVLRKQIGPNMEWDYDFEVGVFDDDLVAQHWAIRKFSVHCLVTSKYQLIKLHSFGSCSGIISNPTQNPFIVVDFSEWEKYLVKD